jgi:hypothetical protein
MIVVPRFFEKKYFQLVLELNRFRLPVRATEKEPGPRVRLLQVEEDDVRKLRSWLYGCADLGEL